MPLYRRGSVTRRKTWAKLIQNPRIAESAKEYIEGVGGKLHGFWYAFGDDDGYTSWEAPDNVSMAATALAIGAGGALSFVQTTVLLTVDETLAARRRPQWIKIGRPGSPKASRPL